jgi:hypothetical protein
MIMYLLVIPVKTERPKEVAAHAKYLMSVLETDQKIMRINSKIPKSTPVLGVASRSHERLRH